MTGAMAFLLLGCSSTYKEVYPTLMDGKYDSEFPYRSSSVQLQQVGETVKMVSAIAFYRNLVFSFEEKVTMQDVAGQFLMDRVEKVVFMNRTSSGTAITIYAENRRVALMTCAHVVKFPDTVLTYYVDQERRRTPFLRVMSIKEREEIYVAGIPGGRAMDVLALDEELDLAVIGKHYEGEAPIGIPVFRYPLGRAAELEWGAFVYVFGYPSGYRMVTKAIVSSPNRTKRGAFLLDAGFKRGYSGGAVLAIRDGVPNFELVGIVRLAKGPTEVYLTPTREGEQLDFDSSTPYKGDVFVERRMDYDYGVAEAVPAEAIAEFLQQNSDRFRNQGYDFSSFRAPRP